MAHGKVLGSQPDGAQLDDSSEVDWISPPDEQIRSDVPVPEALTVGESRFWFGCGLSAASLAKQCAPVSEKSRTSLNLFASNTKNSSRPFFQRP